MENIRSFMPEGGQVATPSFELVKILIMEKQENVSLALGFLEKNKALNLDLEHELSWVVSRNKVLFWSLEPWLLEAWGTAVKVDELYKEVCDVSEEAQVSAFRKMTAFLYGNGLTKINLRRQRQGEPNIEKENEADDE